MGKDWRQYADEKIGIQPENRLQILEGEPIRRYILSNFRQTVDKTSA